ncbi:MAG: hypothetical protein ACTSWA_10630 [Candidatus Thorarchaeota archaeon]
MASYFAVVGVTPKAVANSIAWYIRSDSQPPISEINFITSSKDGITSEGYSKEDISTSVDILLENLKRLSPESIDKIKINQEDPIFIPEANFAIGIRQIVQGIINKTSPGTEIVIDATAGRKSMSAAAVVAGLRLHHAHNRRTWISYYWLHDFSKDTLSKNVWELGLDQAEIVVIGVDQIDEQLTEIKE